MSSPVKVISAKIDRKNFTLDEQKFWLTCGLITLIAAVLRLVSLDVYSPLFNQDEATLGYDAWSIWLTARDQHNQFLPIYFRTFNDAVPPVANYFASPFVGVLGLSQFSIRLPFALLGTVTVFLTGCLGRLWFGNVAGIIAALLLAFEPWHLNYSRTAFPASTVPFLLVVALYSFTRFTEQLQNFEGNLEKRRLISWLVLSAVSFALLTGSYSPLKLEAPLLIGGCVLACVFLMWKHRWISLAWFATYLICVSPLVINQLIQWNQVQTRFNQMSVFGKENVVFTIVNQYFLHYDPQKLFLDGFNGGVAVLKPGIGELFWLEAPLFLIALYYLAFRRKFSASVLNLKVLVIVWFLTFPIASSLTTNMLPHEIRSYNLLPLPELLSGYGVVAIGKWLATLRFGKKQITTLLVVFGLGTFALFADVFITYYFQQSLIDSDLPVQSMPYNLGLEPTLTKLGEMVKPCDTVWMSEANSTYIYYLFFTKYPPALFQKIPKEELTTSDGSLFIPRIAQVTFGSPKVNKDAILKPECVGQESQSFYVTRVQEDLPDWQELYRFTKKDNEPLWRLLVKICKN